MTYLEKLLPLLCVLFFSLSSGATDYYVDAINGMDGGHGDFQNPWRSLKRVNEQLPHLKAGDSINLKRGSSWNNQSLLLRNIKATSVLPFVIRAYGKNGSSAPIIGPAASSLIVIENSSNIKIRDIVITGAKKGPCVKIDHAASYISIMNNEIGECDSNGIRLAEKVHHVEISGNRIGKVYKNDGITIHEVNWGKRMHSGAYAGSHHIIINNEFIGPFHEDAIDITSHGVEDVKIISNTIENTGNAGINIAHGKNIWIYGNAISNTGLGGMAGAIKISGKNSGKIKIVGNLFTNNLMSALLVYAGDVDFYQNTVIQQTKRPLIRIDGRNVRASFKQNVLENKGVGGWLTTKIIPGSGLIVDDNWYSGSHYAVQKGCAFTHGNKQLTILDRRVIYSYDFNSECSNIVNDVSSGSEMKQGRCDNFGVLDCNMKFRDLKIDAIPGYIENNGFGWLGNYDSL